MVHNSINVLCKGEGKNKGPYIHNGMEIVTICKKGYYVSGSQKASCTGPASKCEPCRCSREGSVDVACDNEKAQCTCKKGFYGLKCEFRDCEASEWGPWGV